MEAYEKDHIDASFISFPLCEMNCYICVYIHKMCLKTLNLNASPPPPSLVVIVSMWRTAWQWGAAPWIPRPALALEVWSYRPTFPTASGGNPSSTAPTLTLTFHPKVLPETPPLPVTCKIPTIVSELFLLLVCCVQYLTCIYVYVYIICINYTQNYIPTKINKPLWCSDEIYTWYFTMINTFSLNLNTHWDTNIRLVLNAHN